jgi:hypothetical protein
MNSEQLKEFLKRNYECSLQQLSIKQAKTAEAHNKEIQLARNATP